MDIDHPLNRELLLYLLAVRATYDRMSGYPPVELQPVFVPEEEMGMNGLRTHPDLGGLLIQAGRQVEGVTHGYVLGYDVLANPRGVIIGLAMSMTTLAFHYPPPFPAWGLAKEHAERASILNTEWTGFSPWGGGLSPDSLRADCEKALAFVASLEARR